ncbi:MAG: hypothetical protein ACI8W8_004543 [Rhodothermales bacterium]|jgi:hypothetical protein
MKPPPLNNALQTLRWMFACLALAAGASPQLGPPVQLSDAEVERHTSAGRAAADGPIAGFAVDTSKRNDVLALYHRVYLASDQFAATHGWTGDVDQCLPGTTSSDLKEDTRRRVNYFRAMAGLSANIVFDDENSRKAQEAALIMSRQGGLSHFPNQEFPGNACLSADGHAAAGSSNLSLGNYGPDAINGQVGDDGASNGVVGHRRWILYSRAQEMGTGDVPDAPGRWSSNSLWVIGNFAAAPSPAPEIAWPPAGFVPYHLAPNDSAGFPRWSYAYPGAGFSQATVTMKQGDTAISLVQEPVSDGFGDNTLAWRPSGIPDQAPTVDTSYAVTIIGITNAPFTQRSYVVTLIDPFALNTELTVSGSARPPAGLATMYGFNSIDAVESYDVSIATYSDQAWTEGAEGTPLVIDGTVGSYDLVGNHSVATGAGAFHLATPDFGSTEHVVIDRDLLPEAGSQIQFRYRRLFMHPDTKLRVQLSTDGGQSFSSIHSIDGNNSGSSAQWDPSGFLSATVDIPSSYHGRLTRLRFLLDNTGVAFIGADSAVGIYIDDISAVNCLEISNQTILSLDSASSGFDYTPDASGEQRLLMAGVRLGGRFWGYGEALAVESVPALPLLSVAPAVGTVDVSANTQLSLTFGEAVQKGSGNVVLRQVSNGAVLGSVDVASASVTIGGSLVTIDIPFLLPYSSEVEVDVDLGAFQSSSGAAFAGLGGLAPWRFTTVAPPVPSTILSLFPADDASDVAAAATLGLVITFDKQMHKGSGELGVFRAADNTLLGSVDVQSSEVQISGAIATITASFPLAIDSAYYVTFLPATFVDTDGLDSPGVVGPTAWNFHASDLAFDLFLSRGWNLVSLPIMPQTTNPGLLSGAGSVFTLKDGSLVVATVLQPKQGYLVFNPRAPRSVTVIGQPVSEAQIPVQPGWQLLGIAASPPYDPRAIDSAFSPTPTFAWRLHAGAYRAASVLDAGLGYLIYHAAD